jgi:hypothetical protein
MNRERGETHLRQLAEAELRGAAAGQSAQIQARFPLHWTWHP